MCFIIREGRENKSVNGLTNVSSYSCVYDVGKNLGLFVVFWIVRCV